MTGVVDVARRRRPLDPRDRCRVRPFSSARRRRVLRALPIDAPIEDGRSTSSSSARSRSDRSTPALGDAAVAARPAPTVDDPAAAERLSWPIPLDSSNPRSDADAEPVTCEMSIFVSRRPMLDTCSRDDSGDPGVVLPLPATCRRRSATPDAAVGRHRELRRPRRTWRRGLRARSGRLTAVFVSVLSLRELGRPRTAAPMDIEPTQRRRVRTARPTMPMMPILMPAMRTSARASRRDGPAGLGGARARRDRGAEAAAGPRRCCPTIRAAAADRRRGRRHRRRTGRRCRWLPHLHRAALPTCRRSVSAGSSAMRADAAAEARSSRRRSDALLLRLRRAALREGTRVTPRHAAAARTDRPTPTEGSRIVRAIRCDAPNRDG